MAKEKATAKKPRTADGRTRNFATVVYPDSEHTPENWQEVLGEFAIPAFISPIHDKDTNPGGESKKPHYHVMLMFEGKKSSEQVREIIDSIGGVGLETVQSVRGYARYLCHLDNPEKAQYDKEQVRCLGGADYTTTIGLVTDKYKAIKEMRQWCIENNVFSYADLFDYCAEERMDWFRVLCDNGTVVIKEYLKSRSWTIERKMQMELTAKETAERNEKWTRHLQEMKEQGMIGNPESESEE